MSGSGGARAVGRACWSPARSALGRAAAYDRFSPSLKVTVTVPDDLKRSLKRLREVRARRPSEVRSLAFAEWRDEMAAVLEELAQRLLFAEDRERAAAEAEAAHAEANEIRARHG